MTDATEIDIDPGTPIEMAAHELCFAARAHGHAVMLFNDIRLEATEHTQVGDVLAEWDEIMRSRELEREHAAEVEKEELRQLRAFRDWVESWVSNPVGAYSVSALDGLFGMTRDKIAAIRTLTAS
jgi:hypothetical protein